MGLIKSAVSAVSGTLKDQWKEALRCEDMGNEILMKKVTTPTKVITNKSVIIVGPGQCAVVYDNGRIIDATAEEGIYTFDTSSSPSFFAGQFGAVFKEMWQRFTFGGGTAKEQAVFFFNIKEIIGNKFGTPAPVPFQDWSHPIPNQMTGKMLPLRVEVKCFGKYTFRIENPALFMSQIAGMADIYKKDELVEQMRSEVIASFQNVLNELGTSAHQIPVLELPSQTDEIKQIMDEKVFDEPIRKRGIQLEGFAIESVTLDDESSKKIDQYELGSNSYMQQGKLVGSYGDAIKDAANNANGAANGFMGIGMMNMASGGVMGGAANGPWANADANASQQIANNAEAEKTTDNTWTCPICGATATGNFCQECGAKKPEAPSKKFCPQCGKEVSENDKFCPECGAKL